MNEPFKGTGVALVTPFNADLTIDFKGLRQLLIHTGAHVNYFVVQGTTGESATINAEEKTAILDFVLENNPGKLPVVYGIGGNDTADCLRQISHTSFDGIDAILSVSPYYNKPSQEGIYQHYKRLADASPVPVILYNVPGRTGSNIQSDTTLRLAEHDNIVGIKDASCNFQQLMNIAKYKPVDFSLISGDDIHTTAIIGVGGSGVISVMANGFPDVFRSMVDAALANQCKEAQQHLYKLLELIPLMFEEGNPVGIKQLLHLMNICEPFVRLPLTTASANLKRKIKQQLEDIIALP